MKRQITRERKLPAFSLSAGELELLWDKLLNLFDQPDAVYRSLEIQLPNEELSFTDVKELLQYNQLPAKLNRFTLYFHHNGRSVSIRQTGMMADTSTARAVGDSESWCAGVIDTVHTFAEARKTWYSFFVTAPIGLLLFLSMYLPWLASLFLGKEAKIDKAVTAGWTVAIVVLVVLFFGRGKLLPSATIRIKDEKGFVSRHAAELSLAVALFSAALTVIGWFVSK